MFIPRTLSSAAETSIATSSHSFNFSSSSSGLIRSSQSSDNRTILTGSTTSTSYSTTASHSFTSISLASTKKVESGSNPSNVASATAAASRTSGSPSSSVKQPVLTKLTMTAKSEVQTKSSVAVNSSTSGGSPSPIATSLSSASTSSSDVKKSVSATSSGPSSTHSGTTSQSISHGTSVAVTKPNAGPTSISTITDRPFSTFSTPVSATLINPSNGESATTVPLLLGTSTNSAGSTIAYTHVIANPTGSFSSGSVMSQSSFLRKPSEVIGTFLAVGIILAALIGCAIYLLRRRQHRQHRDHTRVSIKWPPADPGFSLSDLPEVPPMRTISIDVRKKPSVVWGPRSSAIAKSSFADLPRPLSTYTPSEPRGIGLAGVGAGGILMDQNVGPFGDLHAVPGRGETTTGLAVTTSQEVVRMRTYSYTPSSPSLYPESMKTANEDADSLYEREMGISTQDIHVDPSHISKYRPLTPPASVSSGFSSVTPTTKLSRTTRPVWSDGTEIPQLIERQIGVLTRRSLLNIRSVTPQK